MKITKKFWGECILIVIMALVMAFIYQLFIVPNDFAPSGINGVAVMIQHLTGFSLGYFSLIINVPLCIFSFFCTNREFAIKTFLFVLVYSLFFILLQNIDLSALQYDSKDVDTIYPVLIAGSFAGFVYGISIKMNSSTGGVDVISKHVSAKNPLINFFWITFIIKACVAVASFFVYAKTNPITGELIFNYKPVCLCMLYSFMSAFVGNYMMKGSKTALKFIIITKHADEISKEIVSVLHHGATVIPGKGIYSGEVRDVIICVVNKRQIVDFEAILKKYPDTFSMVETVNETIGIFNRSK